MSRMFIAAGLVLAIAAAQAPAIAGTPPCRPDKISNASGLLISLASGQDYQAYPGSQGTMSTWEPRDKVTVCMLTGIAVKITNSSQKYQSVKALRVYPGNSGGLL